MERQESPVKISCAVKTERDLKVKTLCCVAYLHILIANIRVIVICNAGKPEPILTVVCYVQFIISHNVQHTVSGNVISAWDLSRLQRARCQQTGGLFGEKEAERILNDENWYFIDAKDL